MCDLDDTGGPSTLRVILSAAALVRMLPTLDRSCEEKTTSLKWNWPLVDCIVYYESIKREVSKRLICECRCDVRLKVKVEGSTRLAYTRWRKEP